MFAELIRKRLTTDEIAASIRKRHSLADDTEIVVKTMPMMVEPHEGDAPHKFKARITTECLDRDEEVMIPQGMDASEFEKSGAIFWNHNYDLPIAKAGRLVRGTDCVDAYAEFAKRPDDYQGEFFPDFARAMVQQGVVKGVSIGFVPLEGRNPTKKDHDEYGEKVRRIWSKWKLLEWSIAPVQSNPEAVVTEAIAKGLIQGSSVPSQPTPAVITSKRSVYFIGFPAPIVPDVSDIAAKALKQAEAKRRGTVYYRI